MILGVLHRFSCLIVGMAGFEPAASTSQMWRDTGLRYIPFGIAKVGFLSAMQNKKSKKFEKS